MSTSSSPRSGLDLQFVDLAVRPQDDLFGHLNGKWLDSFEIPEDRSEDGAFRTLIDQSEQDVRAIIEEAATLPGAGAQQIADLYASFMDVERIESQGAQPLQPLLDEIANAKTKSELATVLGRRQREGLASLFGTYVDQDSKNSERYLVHVTQGGLGLPDESFYEDESHEPIRAAYVEHLTRLAELVGLANPKDLAESVMDLETALARAQWDRATNRDAERTYNLLTFAQLHPSFNWNAWATAIGATQAQLEEIVVRQPSFVEDAAKLWAERPLEQWQAWLSIRITASSAAYLSDAIVEQNFSFYGRTLSGTPKLRERWKRGIALVEGALGEAIGKIYVERHFPPSHKDHMQELVANLLEAYRQSIDVLDWMSPATRQKALEKLDTFRPKIGYPDKWKDYSTLEIKRDDLLGNVRRSGIWETEYELHKLGKPVDKDEWFMPPQMVNAYYNPAMNEIVFPAAILQPPFFDAEADDAANYGGIGAVIGHEIGHGFDDQGSRYDGEGNLTDWWESTDREEFERRAETLIQQYNGLTPLGLEEKVNGALTVGENIGDLGGLTIALKAYVISLDGKDAPVIDGYSGIQRVFLGWAQVWRSKIRKEEALRRLTIDPHSPANLRCNAIVANIDAYYDEFDVKEGDEMFIPPNERVRIW